MLSNSAARPSVKKAVAKAGTLPGRAIGWREVVRCLQSDEARSVAMGRYRSAGYTPDDFGGRRARVEMAGALTAAEDWLENERRSAVERAAIRAVRRRLEVELWP